MKATAIAFQALDILDDIYLNKLMPDFSDPEIFADHSMSKVHIRIKRENRTRLAERVYHVKGDSDSLVRVSSFPDLMGDSCINSTVGIQFLESNFNPYEYSNNSHEIGADVTGLGVKCGNRTLPVSGLSEPIDILTRRSKNDSISELIYVFKASEPLGNMAIFQFFVRTNRSALSLELDFNNTLYPPDVTMFLRKEAPPTPAEFDWTASLPVPDEQMVYIPWTNGTKLVGLISNTSHIHCRCYHLTKFSGFVAPNPLNIAEALSANVLENPSGLVLVLTVFAAYLMGIVWARKSDRRDVVKAGIGILPGHKLNPRQDCQYLITVYTGFKGNSGTTAEVTIVLCSQDHESPPFTLSDQKRILFERGSVDSFLVSTSQPLGALRYIRVWHNNGGYSPGWFLSQIVVTNRGNNTPNYFICNRWFALDRDDGNISRVLIEADPEEMKKFRNLFLAKSSRDMNDGHLWFSVAGRPARSPFSRVQRLSCCLTLLYSTMVTNIMFFGRGDDFDPPEPIRIGGIEIDPPISLPQIMIGLQSAAIIMPVNLIIVFLFRNSGSRSSVENEKTASRNNVSLKSLTKCLPQKKQNDKEASKKRNEPPSLWHRKEKDTVQKRQYHDYSEKYLCKRPIQLSFDESVDAGNETDPEDVDTIQNSSLPWWSVYIGWLLVWSASFLAAFFTVLYSLSFGRAKAEAWLVTFLTSFLTDLFLIQPFKLMLVAVLFALLAKKPVEDEDPVPTPLHQDEEYLEENTNSQTPELVHSNSPSDEADLAKQRAVSLERSKRRKQVLEVLLFGLFVTVIMVTSYGERSSLAFHVTKNVHRLLSESGDIGFSEIKDIPSFWTWVTTGLIPATRAAQWYNGRPSKEAAILEDMLTHPLGPVQLRQVRLTPGFPYFGKQGTYLSGGYVTSLGSTQQTSLTRAAYLQKHEWLDDKTRAVFIELTLYNPHVNLFSLVSMATEFTSLGTVYKGSEVVTLRLIQHDAILLLVLRGCLAIFIVVFMIREGKALFSRPFEYLSEFWSWVELLVIAVGFSALGVYFHSQSIIDDVAIQRAAGNASFGAYKSAVGWFEVYTNLLGLLICCATLKFVRILRFNSHVYALSMTMRRSLKPVAQFMLTAGILIMAFTQTANLIFGVKLAGYKNITSSLQSLLFMMLGSFDFEELEQGHSLLGPLMFFTYQCMMQFFLLSMFMAIIMDVYAEETQSTNTDELNFNAFVKESAIRTMKKVQNRKSYNVDDKKNISIKDKGTLADMLVKIDRMVDQLDNGFYD
ncbi:PREDICTED: polycystic kidney disease protein 1-like 2 [Branchiostoma belcheri]|uniref:Polycystic kidney disease protein 1-like 2 n=1 Tax=Branchiostoma belcheri TaxID=7741 RepID=A0A6P4ZVV6_BRABE|nr:PREDICTED: polycystic kidney disease protein 1-like 2 [Branchiostoma belcheri]